MGTLYKFGFLDSFSLFDRMRDRRGRKIDYIQLIGSQSYAITISKDVNWRNFARYYLPPLDSTIAAQQKSLRDSPPTSFDNLRLQMKNIDDIFKQERQPWHCTNLPANFSNRKQQQKNGKRRRTGDRVTVYYIPADYESRADRHNNKKPTGEKCWRESSVGARS
jgi:hypothetical protein